MNQPVPAPEPSSDERQPPSIDDVTRLAEQAHARIKVRLATMREQRDRLNKEIALLVPQLEQAERVLRATKPRTRKPKP